MKISKTVIEKIKNFTLSKTDINILIYLASKQLDNGHVYNVYYKDVVDTLKIAPRTFYKRLAVLECRNIITYEISQKYGYYNVVILDNDFSNKDFSNGYVNINRAFFFSDEFLEMKASEKYVLLKLMSRNNDRYNEIKVSDAKVAEYANIDPKNKRLIKRIVETLSNLDVSGEKVFDVFTSKRPKHNVHFFRLVFNSIRNVSAKQEAQIHMFENYCRKHRISYTEHDIESLVQMNNEYAAYSSIYIAVVKEILHQYKEVKAAIIRKVVKPVIERISKYSLGEPIYTPLY